MGRIRGQLGQQRQIGLITFRNPALNDSLTSMQLDVYKSATNYVTYFERKTGASVTFGRWFSEYVSGSIGPYAEEIKYSNPTASAPALITIANRASVDHGVSGLADPRHKRLLHGSPHRLANFCRSYFGTPYLGGTNDFYKYTLDVNKYTPLPFDTRLSIRARYGVVRTAQCRARITGSSYRTLLRWRHQYHARVCLRQGGTSDVD